MLRHFRNITKANKIVFHRETYRSAKALKFIPAIEPATKSPGGKTLKKPSPTELSQETIELLQKLSLVGFEKKEVVKIVQEAITFADRIFEVDTSEVKPLVTLLEDEFKDFSYRAIFLREDEPELDVTREELLSNSKVTQEHYFVSPIGNQEAKFEAPAQQSEKVVQN